MHRKLHDNWTRVLAERGGAVALVDAESATACTFQELDERALSWLAEHAAVGGAAGDVWCLSVSDRVCWLTVFLAAIKVGAVVLPLEAGQGASMREQAANEGASLWVDDAGVQRMAGGRRRREFFLIKRTSGTSGVPRSLPFTEAEMIADGRQIMKSMGISADDRNFAVLPLGHSYGLGNLVMPFFMEGVPIVFGSAPYPQVIGQEISQFPCSVLPLVPPLVKAMAQVNLAESLPSELRLVISAGGRLLEKIAQRFYENTGLRVHNFYGSSETGGICFNRSGKWSFADGAVGQPLHGVELSIGPDHSIEVRSDALCHAVYPKGRCVLHDFGRLDDSGGLHLLGRHADIVKVAGRRISLSEIEATICSLEQVTDAYVSSRVGRSGETRCVALFSGEAPVERVKVLLQAKFPHWKIPKLLSKVEQVAYNGRGKKDRTLNENLLDSLIARS